MRGGQGWRSSTSDPGTLNHRDSVIRTAPRTHSHTPHASRAALFKHTHILGSCSRASVYSSLLQTAGSTVGVVYSITCYLDMYVYVRDGDRPSICPLVDTFKKSQMRMVSSWELLMIWNSSNCSRNTRPECSYTHTHPSIHLSLSTCLCSAL